MKKVPVPKDHLVAELVQVIGELLEKKIPPRLETRLVEVLTRLNADEYTEEIL